ncbi:MAG: ABC transporter permease [Bacilli bacterium]|nr:ABC transporter permease [Bacilli bacterium]
MVTLIPLALRAMAVYIFGATGDTIIEKGGHLNMGVPGIMFIGALGAIVGESLYANNIPADQINVVLAIIVPMIFAMIFAGLAGLLYCFLTVTLKCNQNVVGLSLTTFGVGFSRYFIAIFAEMADSNIPVAGDMIQHLFPNYAQAGAFGEMFLSGSFFTYFSILLAILISILFVKTKVGLNLRAVGENPASADAAGINVTAYRYIATIIGSMVVGIGGLTYVLDLKSGSFAATNDVDAFGWLCLSIVILSAWRSWITIPVSFAIGLLDRLPAALGLGAGPLGQFIGILPYIATIVVLIISSAISSKKMQPPAGLGQNYFREDR